jgi:hypothetical protein
MREKCNCLYCKEKIDEYFCSLCFHNFNLCEVEKVFDYMVLCPKCNKSEVNENKNEIERRP